MERIIKLVGVAAIIGIVLFFAKTNSTLKIEVKTAKKEVDEISKEFNRINNERAKLAEENMKQKIAINEIGSENEDLKAKLGELEEVFRAREAEAVRERTVTVSSPEEEEARRLKKQLETIFSANKEEDPER